MNEHDHAIFLYLQNKVDEGFTLKELSVTDNKNAGYYSNWLKQKNLILPNNDKLKQNKADRVASVTKKSCDPNHLRQLILENLTSVEIGKKINMSSPTILKLTKELFPELEEKLRNNGTIRRHTSKTGVPNLLWKANKGKTYEEIYGPEKAIVMRGLRSDWLKNNNIRKFATRVSKPQAMLFEIVKNYFPTAILEQDIKLPNGRIIWLDIAILEKKICIEYDGMYWHKINQNNTRVAVKDEERDRLLKSMGWTVYRIQSEENPSKEELIKMFLALECTND